MLRRYLLGCLVALVVARPGWAGTDAATAESLMRRSGLWEQLAAVAPQVRSGMLAGAAQARGAPSESELARLSRAVDAAYSVQRLRAACLAVLAKDLDPRHVAALRRWYDGPHGRTIVRLEQEQLRQDPQAIVDKAGALLAAMPAARRRTLNEIVLATRSAEWMAELHIGTALAAQQGAASMWPNAARPSAGQLKTALEAQRQQLIRTFGVLSLASFAVAYSTVPTPDLERYVEFLKSEAAKDFNAASMRAISGALFDAASDLGRTAPGARDKTNT